MTPRTRLALPAALLAAVLIALVAPAAAPAHGDPSSHYLETDQLYPGFANRPSQQVELELAGLLEAARQAGYPIKVGLVGSPDDLTEDASMFKKPQPYAEYVSAVLGAPNVKAPLLIVTPNGIGVSGAQELDGRLRPVRRADARGLLGGARTSPDATGDELARAAMLAVRRIAQAGGHPLPRPCRAREGAHVEQPRRRRRISGSGFPSCSSPSVFFTAWLWFEARNRIARRGARVEPS